MKLALSPPVIIFVLYILNLCHYNYIAVRLSGGSEMECRTVFIDESGAGANKQSKDNFWISAGVCVKFEDHDSISDSVYEMKKRCFRLYNQELKGGSTSPSSLNSGVTKEDVAKEIGQIITQYQLKVWTVSTRYSDKILQSKFISSNGRSIQAKDVSRELLMEGLSDHAECHEHNQKYQLIWDLSDQQEMSDFSSTISKYINPHSKKKVCNAVIPFLLAGLSHEWAELQIADVVSNYALNYSAAAKRYPDADLMKADAFKKYIYPVLMQDANGAIEGAGWKVYDH